MALTLSHHQYDASVSDFVRAASLRSIDDAASPTSLAPHLTLQPMKPVMRSSSGAAARWLMDVEWVEVVGAASDPLDDTTYYEICVYTREPVNSLHGRNGSRLPAKPKHHAQKMEKPSRREPNYRVRRRFSDVNRLRYGLMDVVQQSHGYYCDLCNEFQSLLLFSSTRPVMVARMLLPSVAFRTKVLDKFVREVVGQFQGSQDGMIRRPKCQAAHEIPVVLRDFLTW